MFSFEKLPQLEDRRGKLAGIGYSRKRKTALKDCQRAWHHSLTRKHLSGATAAAFANYHVFTLGWPGVGYHLVIEPKNVIDTAAGKRAKIVYANDVNLLSYHVGNSNDFAIGICVAGDYRYDELDDATKATIDELQEALVNDGIGNKDKSHHEFWGYDWKQCCVFDYKEIFKFLDHTPKAAIPDVYEIQAGDTLYGIANGEDAFNVEDLMRWNDIEDATKIQVGQKIYLKAPSELKKETPKPTAVKAKVEPPKVLWMGYIKVNTLNVRKGAGTSYPVAEQLSKNDQVTVYKELSNGWLYIGDGKYISNASNKYVGKGKAAYKHAGKRVVAIVDKVNFYTSQRWDNPTGQFKRGEGWTIVDLVNTNGSDQLKVKNSRGHVYYITARKDLVKIV